MQIVPLGQMFDASGQVLVHAGGHGVELGSPVQHQMQHGTLFPGLDAAAGESQIGHGSLRQVGKLPKISKQHFE